MAKYDGAEIEIVNWEKYNPRKDLKATSWFRFQNSIFEDPNFIEFSHSEIVALIYLLTLASKKQNGSIRINYAHANRLGRLDSGDLESALEKLQSIQFVRITSKVEHVDVTRTSRGRHVHVPLRNETNVTKRNETNETNKREAGAFVSERPTQVGETEPGTAGKGGAGKASWEAYKTAYANRYGEPPTWNAKVAGQIKYFVSRVPKDEAPEIAAFYVSHPAAKYVNNMHPVGLLLQDAEKLRTEWATDRHVTATQGRQSEKAAGYQSQLDRIARGEL